MKIASLVLIVFLVFFAQHVTAEGGGAEAASYFNYAPQSPILSITAFTVTPSSVTQGSSVDYAVTISNSGDLPTNVTSAVFVLNSTGDVVLVTNLANASLASLEVSTFTASGVSLASLPVGTYTARANASYVNSTDTFTYSTGNRDVNFTIVEPVAPVRPGGGGGAGGGGGGASPSALSAIPLTGIVSFGKKPVVFEVVPNTQDIFSVSLTNAAKEVRDITVSYTSDIPNLLSIDPSRFVLQAAEKRSFNVLVNVPNNTDLGDHVVELEIKNANGGLISRDFIVFRVKKVQPSQPIVLKTIVIDVDDNSTVTKFTVRNPGNTKIDSLVVQDTLLPNPSKTTPQVQFSDLPGKVINENGFPQVVLEFSHIIPNEVASAQYVIKNILADQGDYMKLTSFFVYNPKLITAQDAFKVTGLKQQTITNVQSGLVTVTILYTGATTSSAKIGMTSQSTFSVAPEYRDATFVPGQSIQFDFRLTTLSQVPDGTYSVNVVIDSDVGLAVKPVSVVVAANGLGVGGNLGASLPVFPYSISDLGKTLGIIFAAIVILFLIRQYVRRKKLKREIDEGITYLRNK